MTALLAVLASSLLGSIHCVSMCGGFATAVASVGGSGRSRTIAIAGYHLGRLLGYAALGALAALVGAGLQGAGSMAGVRDAAGIAMGLVLVGMGVRALLPRLRIRPTLHRIRRGPGLGQRLHGLMVPLLRRGGPAAAGAIGLLSAVLPCGWLWGYVATAAATSDPLHAVAVMVAFWLGTVPAVVSVGLFAGVLARRVGRHAPRITAVLMIGLGLLALGGKLGPAPVATDDDPTPPCHRHHS